MPRRLRPRHVEARPVSPVHRDPGAGPRIAPTVGHPARGATPAAATVPACARVPAPSGWVTRPPGAATAAGLLARTHPDPALTTMASLGWTQRQQRRHAKLCTLRSAGRPPLTPPRPAFHTTAKAASTCLKFALRRPPCLNLRQTERAGSRRKLSMWRCVCLCLCLRLCPVCVAVSAENVLNFLPRRVVASLQATCRKAETGNGGEEAARGSCRIVTCGVCCCSTRRPNANRACVAHTCRMPLLKPPDEGVKMILSSRTVT